MTELLVGTDRGLFRAGDGEAATVPEAPGGRIAALAEDGGTVWVLADGSSLVRSEDGAWRDAAILTPWRGTCLLPDGNAVLVGTAEAGLLEVRGGATSPVTGFDAVPGRGDWYTPWGGPPDTRSLARGPEGALHANVHVGGIPRSDDGGATWRPTIDVDADVHQVLAHPARPDVVLASTARGLAVGTDGGRSWTFHTEGLHGPYSRAVALAGDGETVLVSASEGHVGRRSALYRGTLGDAIRFARCAEGLPESFDANIDTATLVAAGERAAFGTADGRVYVS